MQENNPIPTPETTTPIAVEQPKQSNFLTVLLSILLIISISIAGFFAYQTQKLVGELDKIQTIEKTVAEDMSESVTTESSEVDPTANWKTYTSNNQLDIPESYFEKFKNLKNDLPKSFTFKHPSTWRIVKFGSSEYQKTVNLGYLLYKTDPSINCGNGGGGGPCDNSANILFRFGMVDSTIKDFDQTFWGEGFPIDHKTNAIINGINVVQSYPDKASQYPEVSLFKIAPSGQLYVKTEFFNNDKNDTQYSKETINEINQILSTFKFLE